MKRIKNADSKNKISSGKKSKKISDKTFKCSTVHN